MTYSILLLCIVIIVGVLSIHMNRRESFSGDFQTKSTIVAQDGNFTSDITAHDIEVIADQKKFGKICFNNSYDCLNKNNIISIFTAADINDQVDYVYNTLDRKLSKIEYWNKGTTDQNTLKKYLRQNYSLPKHVYTRKEMNDKFQPLFEDNKLPYTFLEAAGNYLPRNDTDDPYLLDRNAKNRYYALGSNGDPYLTEKEAKSLLEPIRKANQSPHITLDEAGSITDFSKYIPGLNSTLSAEQQKEDTYWDSKLNTYRVARKAVETEVHNKRKNVFDHIHNTKVVCNPIQANDYLYKIKQYVSESTSLVNQIKLKLIHMNHENDKLLEDIESYKTNIKVQYDTAEETAPEITRIYQIILEYIQQLPRALSLEAITKIEQNYKKDHDTCKEYRASLKAAESSAKTDLGKIQFEYNKLYQSSIIDDAPNNQTPQQSVIYKLNTLYIQCNTYIIDQYVNEIVKNTKEGYRIYSFLTNQLDKAALNGDQSNRISNTLNGLYNIFTLSYQNSIRDQKFAYAEKEKIYNQLLLVKNATQNSNFTQHLTIAHSAHAKFTNELIPSIINHFEKSTEAIREIKNLYVILPVRQKWMLVHPYKEGNTIANMTFSPNKTVTWNFNNPSLKKQLTGLRCIESDSTKLNKNLVGIELLNPDGTTYTKGMLGRENPFYIRILAGENATKICKLDTSNKIVVASLDPGYFRDYTYYFYFEASSSENYYYLRCLYKDLAMIQQHRFIRPTFKTPTITEEDAFLWNIV